MYVAVVVLLYIVHISSTVLCELVPFKINISGEKLNNTISWHFLLTDLLIIPLASVTSALCMDEIDLALN